MKKKNVLSLMLMVSIGLAPGMQANVASFTDMPSDWSTSALEKAVKNNLLQGFENQIMPKKNLTRAEMATVVSKMLGLTEQGNLSGFTDVSSDKWYYGAMQKVYAAGIITGDGHGKLNPESNITREETAVILSRILMLTSNSGASGKFGDSANVSSWGQGGLNALIDKGYMQGSDNALNPKQNITSKSKS